MPGINGTPLPDRPLRGRLVDLPGGVKEFAWVCGKNLCDTNILKERMFDPSQPGVVFPILPVVFQGRFIDFNPATGLPRYAVASECRPQPIDFPTVNFVKKTVWAPPFGVTDVLRFKFIDLAGFPRAVACFGQDPPNGCPYVYLHYDGGSAWTGTFHLAGGDLGISLALTGTQDPDRPLVDGWPVVKKWEVTFSGCKSPSFTTQAHATCYWPLTLGGQGLTLGPACCPDGGLPPDFAFRIEGFTNRTLPARLVDLPGGVQQYYTSTCCPPDPDCDVADCCGCDVSPYQWTFPIAGVANGPGPPPPPGTICPSINGDILLTYASNDGSGNCQWTGHVIGVGNWVLQCNIGLGKYFLSFDGSGGAGGAAQYTANIADWNCLGANVMTLVAPTNLRCVGWPASITVSPV